MSYISGARSLPDEQVRIASTKMDGDNHGLEASQLIQRYYTGLFGYLNLVDSTRILLF